EHLDAEDLARPAVVGDVEDGFRLDHVSIVAPTSGSPAPSSRPRIACTAQRLSRDRGRVSMMRTRSPTPHLFVSSCALYFTRCVRYLRYLPWRTRRATTTTTVLFILSDTTVPSRCLRRPVVAGVCVVLTPGSRCAAHARAAPYGCGPGRAGSPAPSSDSTA